MIPAPLSIFSLSASPYLLAAITPHCNLSQDWIQRLYFHLASFYHVCKPGLEDREHLAPQLWNGVQYIVSSVDTPLTSGGPKERDKAYHNNKK